MSKRSCITDARSVNEQIQPYAKSAHGHILAAQSSAVRASYEPSRNPIADHNRLKRIAGALSLLAEAIAPLTVEFPQSAVAKSDQSEVGR